MKKLSTFVLACLSLVSFSILTPSYAGNQAGTISITAGEGYEFFASKRRLKNTNMPFIALGYGLTQHWGIEAALGFFNTKFDRSTHEYRSVDGSLFTLDGIYHFYPQQGIEPFAELGVGVTSLNPNRYDANNEGNINAGVGVQLFANEIVALRVEARDLYTWVGGKNDVVLNAGVTLAFDCFWRCSR